MAQRPGLHAPIVRDAMAYVLAGGRGSRLLELTDVRAKPAVYFGGKSRIIDFCAVERAELRHQADRRGDAVAKAHSLIRHLQRGWNFFRPERNEGFDILPASQRSGDSWYAGTADALFQNIDIIEGYKPEYIVILAGDHIYKMDYAQMLVQHAEQGADVTVGCIEVPRMEATGFGVMHVDATDRIIAFVEKPADPPPMPGNPEMSLASMGIYVFQTKFLIEQLKRDAADVASGRDFGKDIIQYLVQHGKAVAHRFTVSCVNSGAEQEAHAGATSARSTRTGKPTSTSPPSSRRWISTIATGRSGPTPRSRPPPNSSTRKSGAAARRSPRWFPAAASSPAPSCASRCCSPASTFTPIRASKMRSSCRTPISAAARGCET